MRKSIFIFFLLLLPLKLSALNPWLLEEETGEMSITPVFQSFDRFYQATQRADLPFGHLNLFTLSSVTSYGVSDEFNIDITLGYTRTSAGGDLSSEEGLDDSHIAGRYNLIDEFAYSSVYMPTVTVGIDLTIAGTYDEEGFPRAPGDGSHGIALQTGLGKVFGTTGFGMTTDIAYNFREGIVPDQLLWNTTLFYSLLDNLRFGLSYRAIESFGGIDLDSSEFTPQLAPGLNEDERILEYGLSYDINEDLTVSTFYAYTTAGRNTGVKDIFGASLSIPFSLQQH